MSRVVYSETRATAEQEALRVSHGVRLVGDTEEGTGVNALPGGTYGYTYSPALPNAPLFATRRYRSYETHKRATGEIFVVGFAIPAEAQALASTAADLTLQIHAEPDAAHTILVLIPYSRIRRHRQYAAPNEQGFTVTVGPAVVS